jgi:enoyl-CoA hydratase
MRVPHPVLKGRQQVRVGGSRAGRPPGDRARQRLPLPALDSGTEVGVGVALRYETPHIVVLTIDCPPSNAFSWESRQSMLRALDIVEADDDVRAVVITGTGRAFTSGANLREDQALTDAQLADYIGEFSGMPNRIEALRMPVIAAINGASVGGGLEFALACDIRIASTDAFFVAAGVNVGLLHGGAGLAMGPGH